MLRFVFILFFISLQAHAVNKVTVCDSCNAASMKSISKTVLYWNESGYSYVVDRNSRISRKFKIETVYIKGNPVKFTMGIVGRNLAILKKYTPNIDPESTYNNSNAQGLEYAGAPATRTFGVNLNARF